MTAACPDDPWLTFAHDLERERPALLKYLQGQRVPPPDQKELAAEVILVAWASRCTYDPSRASLRTWLTGIAANLLSHYRKLARHRREQLCHPEHFYTLGTGDLDTELRLILKEHRAILDQMLEKLLPERRQVFVLFELQEMKLREIAGELGISEVTVWTRLRLAREDLAEIAKRWHAAEAHSGRRIRRGLLLPLLAGAQPIAPVSTVARLAAVGGVKWMQMASAAVMIAFVAPHDARPERAAGSSPSLFAEVSPAPVLEPPPPPSPPPLAEPPASPPPSVTPAKLAGSTVPGAEHHHIHLARAHRRAGRIARAIAELELHARRFPNGELAATRNNMLRELKKK